MRSAEPFTPLERWHTDVRRTARRVARDAARALLDLALPRHCVSCGGAVERGSDDVVCGAC
jgi:hypothetical protein